MESYQGLRTISLGHKMVDGETTGENCIVIGVNRKKPVDQFTHDQLLPAAIEHQGHMIKTDVEQDDSVASFEGEYCPNVTDTHRDHTRPLTGGVSVGNSENAHRFTVGTLGMLVVDTTDGQIVGLSNNHVITPEIFTLAGDQTDLYNYKDVAMYQPSRAEQAGRVSRHHRVGEVKRVYPLRNTRVRTLANEIDAGIFSIDSDVVLGQSSRSVLKLLQDDGQTNTTLLPLATEHEVDQATDPSNNIPLFKSSRTTGATGSAMSPELAEQHGFCSLQVSSADLTSVISGRIFKNVARYWDPTPPRIDPSTGGDSGSVICAWLTDSISGQSQWKAIGLHFAGTRIGGIDYGIMCRMDRVVDLLKIGSFTEGTDVDSHGNTSPKYKIMQGLRSDMYMDIDGVTYWQVGATSEYIG